MKKTQCVVIATNALFTLSVLGTLLLSWVAWDDNGSYQIWKSRMNRSKPPQLNCDIRIKITLEHESEILHLTLNYNKESRQLDYILHHNTAHSPSRSITTHYIGGYHYLVHSSLNNITNGVGMSSVCLSPHQATQREALLYEFLNNITMLSNNSMCDVTEVAYAMNGNEERLILCVNNEGLVSDIVYGGLEWQVSQTDTPLYVYKENPESCTQLTEQNETHTKAPQQPPFDSISECPQTLTKCMIISVPLIPPPNNHVHITSRTWRRMCCDPTTSFAVFLQPGTAQDLSTTVYDIATIGSCEIYNNTIRTDGCVTQHKIHNPRTNHSVCCQGKKSPRQHTVIFAHGVAALALAIAQNELSACGVFGGQGPCIEWYGINTPSDIRDVYPVAPLENRITERSLNTNVQGVMDVFWGAYETDQARCKHDNTELEAWYPSWSRAVMWKNTQALWDRVQCEWWDVWCHSLRWGSSESESITNWLSIPYSAISGDDVDKRECERRNWLQAALESWGWSYNISAVWNTTNHSRIRSTMHQYQKGTFCGAASADVSIFSVDSIYLSGYHALLTASHPVGTESDGVVTQTSCIRSNPSRSFDIGGDLTSPFTISNTHHDSMFHCLGDGSVRGVFETDVCVWMRNMVLLR